ncbi:hypothetical protein BDAP_000443 [Binucleata daphniae]
MLRKSLYVYIFLKIICAQNGHHVHIGHDNIHTPHHTPRHNPVNTHSMEKANAADAFLNDAISLTNVNSMVSGPTSMSMIIKDQRTAQDVASANLASIAQAKDFAAMNSALNVEEAMALGMSPSAASAYASAMNKRAAEKAGDAYSYALAGDVVGGGVSGINIGGANNVRAATSNIFHNSLEAALHEAGPFGSKSVLSANMVKATDPTIQQRISESLDTVHDDTLKANLAKKQRLEAQLEERRNAALVKMNEVIKQNASAAARRDEHVSKMKAEAIAARAPNGNLNAIVQGTNKTYGQMVEEELAKAEHAATHARNPDLYAFESAAEKTGFPRPTMGQEVMDTAYKEMAKANYMQAEAAKAEEMKRYAEMKAANAAAAQQLDNEKNAILLQRQEAERRFAAETEAVKAAEANESYMKALTEDQSKKILAEESLAANLVTAGEIRAQKANQNAMGHSLESAGEAAIVNSANQALVENKLIVESAKAAISADEAAIAEVGEHAANAKQLQNMAINMQQTAAARMDLANQKMGEAVVAKLNGADINKAVQQNTNMIAAAGEAAVAQAAVMKGTELAAAAADEAAIAQTSRERGADLAAAAAHEAAIADEARSKSMNIAAEAERLSVEGEMAAAKERALAKQAAKEKAIAAAVKGTPEKGLMKSVGDEVAAKAAEEGAQAEEEQLAAQAGFEEEDPYQILGTIPDDADTVAITNSSLEFPLKTFGQAKAHNQAEAGALASQNKIKDDIRGKVTANKFDSPLNTIKGEGGYLNIPENAEKINVESGRAYFSEAAEASMKKEGLDVGHLEHKINTGERADMGIGLGYYVADVSGMSLDVPSPSNPDPPRMITGKGMNLDISQAQGMDIEKGELKLEKWQEYSRRVRPQVNAEIVSSGREAVIEAVVDDDCIKQALKDADSMFNTKSELIVNPSGESYIRVTPPYGVSEQISYDEAMFNLDRIKQSCSSSHGQQGISMLQESGSKKEAEAETKKKTKGLNIAESAYGNESVLSNEEHLRKSALETASGEAETRHFVKKANAFDNQVHGEKQEICNEGAEALATESGMSVEELEEKGAMQEQIEEEVAAYNEEKKEMEGEGMNMMEAEEGEFAVNEEDMTVAAEVKQAISEHASQIASEMSMSEEEFMSTMSKVSLKTLAQFYEYSTHSTEVSTMKNFEKSKAELRLLFGSHADIFMKDTFNFMSEITGHGDPSENVIIKKETKFVPKIVKKQKSVLPNGFSKTSIHRTFVPITRIVKIPIRKVIRNAKGQEVASIDDKSLDEKPSGNAIKDATNINGQQTITYEGPNGIGTEKNKIKLGDNGMLYGNENDIQNMVDLASIGNITDPNNAVAGVNGIKETTKNGKQPHGGTIITNNGFKFYTDTGKVKGPKGEEGTLIEMANGEYKNSINGTIIRGLKGVMGSSQFSSSSSSSMQHSSQQSNTIIKGKVPKEGGSVIDDEGNMKNITQTTSENENITVTDKEGHVLGENGVKPTKKTTVSPFTSKITEIVIGQQSDEECKDKCKTPSEKKPKKSSKSASSSSNYSHSSQSKSSTSTVNVHM